MNIGQVAERTNLPAKTIRYYEDIGLVKPMRTENGYRAFRDTDLHKLTFLGRARALGFSIEDCRALLALYEDQSRASADVKRLATEHLVEIESKITTLQIMHDTLSTLVKSCAGDDRPDCPILKGLSSKEEIHRKNND
ncbi:Cu(I)-responsive transcriptional regulator [Pseudohalocynthiibacter aestuariivivens]|jgi:MerR family transcriptional regulator, copper efflux regulator|uniref:Cu(I)-responsive transcriptional regulator n=1 Tax=Pseudohalocynthiibacter aestuariivivens TaxID=1591409 RepID=A0ABV5JDY8_9RHOB|nr:MULTISPECIES: Cu(I)-responsive transcriptional regulator [Pseudohalocynthiibacter]MBS9718361.1 Cu(I)-responsive transcriptional regulator [Pseudohalocynthiibacter aestuariivivens]MCK0103370.1 Cu(I)-responsive transcriptional regulator [Pseudohalocynthiibacter sp. F2068]